MTFQFTVTDEFAMAFVFLIMIFGATMQSIGERRTHSIGYMGTSLIAATCLTILAFMLYVFGTVV